MKLTAPTAMATTRTMTAATSARASRPPPRSCDTFVIVGGKGGGDAPGTLFFKNSDRPSEEEHEVVCLPATDYAAGAVVQCTYISIPQVSRTHAVVLSRPRWLWGCEMGANEHGVVGGNEAVGSALADELGEDERLLGMDLLRLALERGSSAREAVDVVCSLLETHGQGGGCEEHDKSASLEPTARTAMRACMSAGACACVEPYGRLAMCGGTLARTRLQT